VKFDQKISSLLDAGKISYEQAEVLRRSLQGAGASGEVEFHHQLPVKIIVGSVAAVSAVALNWYLSTNGGGADQQTIQNVAESLNQVGKVGEMSKSVTSLVSVGLFGLPIIGSLLLFVFSYNGLVSKEEDVLSSWAQVETNYQRRADLIPNLVNVVKAYTEHEGATLENVTALRERIAKLDAQNNQTKDMTQGAAAKLGDDEYMHKLEAAQADVGQGVRGLMMDIENYPNLKASDQFLELQGQLEGTENRIAASRMTFNERVNEFNGEIRRMPGSLVAGMGGFQRKAYFKADAGTEKAAHVEFAAPEAE